MGALVEGAWCVAWRVGGCMAVGMVGWWDGGMVEGVGPEALVEGGVLCAQPRFPLALNLSRARSLPLHSYVPRHRPPSPL